MRLLLTDADNTLWGTNDVYAKAQLRLLEKIEDHLGGSIESVDRLGFIRDIDQSVALEHPRGLRYPPVLLAKSILEVGLGRVASARSQRAAGAAQSTSHFAERVAREFSIELNTSIPNLRLGVLEGLSAIKSDGVQICVLTEGEETRCSELLKHHQIAQYVSSLTSVKKTLAVYSRLKSEWIGPAFMVGDQLDVDVKLARNAGFTSIYFPSDFVPIWASDLDNEADFTIANYSEIASILR